MEQTFRRQGKWNSGGEIAAFEFAFGTDILMQERLDRRP
jgi:hypothetical protein